MTETGLNISLHIDYTGEMQQKIGAQLTTLGRVLEVIENSEPYGPAKSIIRSSFSFQVETEPDLEAWRQDEIDKTFLSMIRSLMDLVDTLLAYKELLTEGIAVTRRLEGEKEVLAYAQQYVENEVAIRTQKIASNSRRSAHQKIRELGDLPTFSKESITSLLLVRRALEHHKRIPKQDIYFTVLSIATFLEGERMELPFAAKQGQNLEARIIGVTRLLPKGEPVLLTVEDIQAVAMTILQELVPGLQGAISSQGAPPTLSWGIEEFRFQEMPSEEE